MIENKSLSSGMSCICILFSVLILTFICSCKKGNEQNEITYETLSTGFKNPPSRARPFVYHWWLGGNVDTARLREEILSLHKAGIAGFTIFEIGSEDTKLYKPGPAFLGRESLEIIKYAVTLAGTLGMEVGLNTASSWNAGGAWISPEHAAKSIYFSKQEISSESVMVSLPFPDIPVTDPWGKPRLIQYGADGKPVFKKEIAVLAVPSDIENNHLDTGRIVNVTQYFNPETEILNWKAPPGEWDIIRYVCSNSGENLRLPSLHSAGPVLDHYDEAATEFHFTYIIERLESVLGDLTKTALKSLYMASYEAKGFAWTTTLPLVFKKINGYDIDKLLPAMFDDNAFTPEIMRNFKADFQRTLSELMINNFYKKSKEICNKHGLRNNSESGGPGLPLHNVPVEPIKALGSLDIPRGEFWINHNRLNEKGIDILRVVKEVSAASHIYNRGIVEMEAFTTFQHWQEGPFEMKPYGDRAFCEGMNKAVIHGSTHNPSGTGYPGIVYLAGTHFNDKRVWWPKINPFIEYLSRVSYILQETDFFADVLYYYGDTIPNYGGHKNSRFSVGPGYDYEIVNTEILLETKIENGKLVLPRNKSQFSVLVLADEYEINPDVLAKLHELIRKGAVIIGSKPKGAAIRSTGRDISDAEDLIDKLWAEPKRSKEAQMGKGGRIYEGIKPSEMLMAKNILPDFSYSDSDFFTLDYIHYGKNDLDFYFIRNTTDKWISRVCSFRQQNKVPSLWNPVTGDIINAAIYNQDNGSINIPLTLAPYGSIFVVFRPDSSLPEYTFIDNEGHPPLFEYSDDGICFWEEGIIKLVRAETPEIINNQIDSRTLEGAWELFFPEGWGAPARKILPKLISWTDSDDEGIKYFSGIVTYKKTFQYDINSTAPGKQKIYLDLGNLSNIGEAWLNGEHLGITWTKPYRFDISDLILPGDNVLVVEIANTWSNRIVGDAVRGEKYTSTNITTTNIKGLNKIQVPWAQVPLIESGLFGPVKIFTLKPVN
jgi:hypothetical protein